MSWLVGYDPPCPDGALVHGPPDGAGRCPWCRQSVAAPMPAPARYPRSELSESYGYHYDPDEGTRGREELRRRALNGLVDS
jgi:hypothetical protein